MAETTTSTNTEEEEEIMGNTHNHTPSEEDEKAIDWVDDGADDKDDWVELGLVGKICTERDINAKAFIDTIKMLWQPKHGLILTKDKLKVLKGQPWHFDRHALLLGEIEEYTKPMDVMLVEFPVWAKVYNLPFKGRLNIANVEAIGRKLGDLIDKSIRLRVAIDVRTAPRGGHELLFDVKYERLLIFCHHYDKLGHGVKDCDNFEDDEDVPLKYGEGLKASPWKKGSEEKSKKG
ncbi:hypothetical protein RDABS01_001096 [Bienertia sinuspersici]